MCAHHTCRSVYPEQTHTPDAIYRKQWSGVRLWKNDMDMQSAKAKAKHQRVFWVDQEQKKKLLGLASFSLYTHSCLCDARTFCSLSLSFALVHCFFLFSILSYCFINNNINAWLQHRQINNAHSKTRVVESIAKPKHVFTFKLLHDVSFSICSGCGCFVFCFFACYFVVVFGFKSNPSRCTGFAPISISCALM